MPTPTPLPYLIATPVNDVWLGISDPTTGAIGQFSDPGVVSVIAGFVFFSFMFRFLRRRGILKSPLD